MEEKKDENDYNEKVDQKLLRKSKETPKELWSKYKTKEGKEIIIYEAFCPEYGEEKHWIVLIKPDEDGVFRVFMVQIQKIYVYSSWKMCKIIKRKYSDVAYIYNNKKKETKMDKKMQKEYYLKILKY